MFDMLSRFFNHASAENPSDGDGHDVRVAVCALFLEMARIDDHFNPEEMRTILDILKDTYQLTQELADALVTEAETALDESIDYWKFASRINAHYTTEEKIAVIELLWRIVFVDGKMDSHENYLVHTLADLLRLDHQQLIDAKLKVLHGRDAAD